MKKTALSLLVAILVLSTIISCKKAARALFPGADFDLPVVNLDLPFPPPVIPGFPVFTEYPTNMPIPLPRVTQKINTDSIIRANTGNNFGIGDIRSIKLKQIQLTIVQGYNSNNNFSNFNNTYFDFSSNTNSDKVRVASLNFQPSDTTSNTMTFSTPDAPELRPYLEGNELYYDIVASLRKSPSNAMRFQVKATLTMR